MFVVRRQYYKQRIDARGSKYVPNEVDRKTKGTPNEGCLHLFTDWLYISTVGASSHCGACFPAPRVFMEMSINEAHCGKANIQQPAQLIVGGRPREPEKKASAGRYNG